MAYQVLARKWRPQQFKDVVGQDHVVKTLENAVRTRRLAHAYLFVGPRGTGKTSLARIFARVLNCPNVKDGAVSCGECSICREVAAGTSLDVIEIDGASNNGVENVRALRDTVQYAPAAGRFKIYIIDEVHMLSAGAFNALLKTLEEPPDHVKFMFATTEGDKVLSTIVSRCQRFDLRRIPVPLLIGRLKEVAVAEGVTIDDDALLAVARGAEGGLRDAESALDQLISFRGNRITEEDVLAVFGLVSRTTLDRLVDLILAADLAGILDVVAELDRGGKDFLRLAVELLGHFRNILVVQQTGDRATEFDVAASQLQALRRQAAALDVERLLRLIAIMIEAEDRMRMALSRRTLLEAALIRCSRSATVVSIEEVIAELRGMGGASAGAPSAAVPVPAAPATAPTRSVPEPAPVAVPVPAASPPRAATTTMDADKELQHLKTHWPVIGEKTERMAVGVRSMLADARPVSVAANDVVIGFDLEFASEMDNFEKVGRNKRALQHVISKELGREVALRFVLSDEGFTHPSPEAKTGTVADPVASAPSAPAGSVGAPRPKSPKEWMADPVVEKTLNLFGGRIVDIRE